MAADKCVWSDAAISTMLDYLIEKDAYKVLDSKRQKNKEMYTDVASFLEERGFKKTADQCRTKFKALKSKYYEAERLAQKSGIYI